MRSWFRTHDVNITEYVWNVQRHIAFKPDFRIYGGMWVLNSISCHFDTILEDPA
jgi:hypothetical protein